MRRAEIAHAGPLSWADLVIAGCRSLHHPSGEIGAVRVSWDFSQDGDVALASAVARATAIADDYSVNVVMTFAGMHVTARLTRLNADRGVTHPRGTTSAVPAATP